jgi:hypothetical protein
MKTETVMGYSWGPRILDAGAGMFGRQKVFSASPHRRQHTLRGGGEGRAGTGEAVA